MKVSYVKLHAGIFIPSLGNISDTLPPSGKTIPNLAMSYIENGSILMSWGKNNKAIISAANVVIAVLAPESNKE